MKRIAVLFLIAALLLPLVATAGEAKGKGSAEVKPPKVLDAVEPEYTAAALEARVEGKVVLDLTVGETGKVEEVAVVEPLSHGLTEAAVDAARQWKFEAPQDAKKIVMRITINFEL
jgi:protein TonB